MRNYQKEYDEKMAKMRLEEELKIAIKERENSLKLAEEELKKAIDDYYDFIKTGNYITDLTEYAGKRLSEIKLVMENDDIFELGGLEDIRVDEDGRLDVNDYDWGLLRYSPREDTYVRYRLSLELICNIKGFFDISVYNEDEE